MKNKIYIFTLLLMVLSLKAQVIGTLEQLEECTNRPNHDEEGCPDLENITYVKDTNNRLDQFVGIWKGSFGGKQYEVHFEKKLQYGEEDIKWDRIFGRMIIKDSNGNIIYNSLQKTLSDTGLLRGGNFQGSVYVLDFIANIYCNDSGAIFIEVSKNNPNQMYMLFDRDQKTYNPDKCPNFTTYVTVIPRNNKITLTRQ
ncbi:DUF6705 family protein [Chryseobacterium sp. JM1]|uniref:DUF6705 family protein n=1 Tax=Chryseobacterium sp. JM1 TaxID=1233950 RepID=UPI0004E78ABE|nr:DUF6705 family protein [Chryseobacterium sp. JM1]KFF23025.1 hypothetical protein IW22_01950 [Chryseobacterium sp. JM1]